MKSLFRKLVVGIVFLTIFLSTMGTAHYYIVKRVALDPSWPSGFTAAEPVNADETLDCLIY